MKLYEALDMNGMPIKNCPSANIIEISKVDGVTKVTIKRSDDSEEQVAEIKDGEKGDPGTSVTILGSFESEEALNEAHPTGEIGQAYLIMGYLYVWNGTAWENVGYIRGPKGDTMTFDDLTDDQKAELKGDSPAASVTPYEDDNGNRLGVTITIESKNATTKENVLDGAKGEKGDSGKGIVDIVKTGSAGNVDTYTINFTDGTSTTFTVSNGRENEKTSQLENDSGFITKLVSNLVNYYTKNETLSTTEITALIEQKVNGERTIVEGADTGKPNVNPEDINPANTYLVKTANGYSMWAWISNDWARLGDTDINLSGYYTMGQVDAKFATKTELEPLVKDADLAAVAKSGSYNDLADKPTIPSVEGFATTAQIDSKVQAAQAETEAKIPDVSGFRKKTDSIPYSELSGAPVIDAALSATSANAVQNKIVYAKLLELEQHLSGIRSVISNMPVKDVTSTDGIIVSSDTPLISDFIVDYNKNMHIVSEFSVSKLGVRYILCGNYAYPGLPSTQTYNLNIEPYSDNRMRVVFGTGKDFVGNGPQFVVDERYLFDFKWTAATKTCVMTLNGTEIFNKVVTPALMVTTVPLKIGTDYRSDFRSTMKIYKFKAEYT